MEADIKLIQACKKGAPVAQRELYEIYRTRWFMICLRYNRNREDALDVLQNALICIFTKMSQFNPDLGAFGSWSNRIVINESIMFLRKKGRAFNTTELRPDLHVFGREEGPIDRLSAEELTSMIQRLPDGYRVVFNMYVIEGYSHAEIAGILGINEGTSKSQLYKARQLLKKNIEVII